MLVKAEILLAVSIFEVCVQPGCDGVFARVHGGRHVADLVLVGEVAARRVHI